jgi:hypothetical protein
MSIVFGLTGEENSLGHIGHLPPGEPMQACAAGSRAPTTAARVKSDFMRQNPNRKLLIKKSSNRDNWEVCAGRLPHGMMPYLPRLRRMGWPLEL